MPQWIVCCPNCMRQITHSEIRKRPTLEDLLFGPPKPTIPGSGNTLSCRSCHKDFVFHRHNLTYRWVSKDRDFEFLH